MTAGDVAILLVTGGGWALAGWLLPAWWRARRAERAALEAERAAAEGEREALNGWREANARCRRVLDSQRELTGALDSYIRQKARVPALPAARRKGETWH